MDPKYQSYLHAGYSYPSPGTVTPTSPPYYTGSNTYSQYPPVYDMSEGHSPKSIEQKIVEMQDARKRTPQQVIRANSDFRRKQSLAEIEDILKANSKDVPYGTPKQLAAFVDLYKSVRAENQRLGDENAILKAKLSELSRLGY